MRSILLNLYGCFSRMTSLKFVRLYEHGEIQGCYNPPTRTSILIASNKLLACLQSSLEANFALKLGNLLVTQRLLLDRFCRLRVIVWIHVAVHDHPELGHQWLPSWTIQRDWHCYRPTGHPSLETLQQAVRRDGYASFNAQSKIIRISFASHSVV